MPILSPADVESRLAAAEKSFPHAACFTCECFLGLVVRLRIDSGPDARPLLDRYKVDRANIHACLGCDPCPPGDCYAAYVKEHPKSTLLTL